MIRLDNLKLPIGYDEKQLYALICRRLGCKPEDVIELALIKRSIDARKAGDVHYVLSVELVLSKAAENLAQKKCRDAKPAFPVIYDPKVSASRKKKVVVVGSGPAGLFCTLKLAESGFKPVLIERGDCIEDRSRTVDRFFETGILDEESNVQFGAGGAGTFSDGKLNTGIKDTSGRITEVLKTFVRFGAPGEILFDAKPHIGTDILKTVVGNIIKEIRELGGSVMFRTKLTGLKISDGRAVAAVLAGGEELPCDDLVLAIGHSARDTFKALYELGIPMEQKDFAVGVRIEHPQDLINRIQYKDMADKLPAAPYKLAYRTNEGRGVYSFCMCPGGYVVNASSKAGGLAVNGMSYSGRDSGNANSALIVTVRKEDLISEFGDDAFCGIRFQEKLEKLTFDALAGKIPQQLYGDFEAARESRSFESFCSVTKGAAGFYDLRKLLPEFVSRSLIEAMPHFDMIMPGYQRRDAILSGVESRTSSPLRILRDETLQSTIRGLYPCGEGAGYAGGIVSAAVDGLKVFEKIAKAEAGKE